MTTPRLHVIPATGCDLALILRRGPSGHVASLLWNRRTGDATLGQWLKGRIYEYRSDLSPDGKHMVIFAGNGKRWWTAVSRAPWLTALAFWPQDHTWHGGGAFTAGGALFLNGATPPETLPDSLHPAETTAFPHATDGIHMGDLYAARLALTGWVRVSGTGYDAVLEKSLARNWRLRLTFQLGAKNRALVSSRYALVNPEDEAIEQPDWTWAEPWAEGLQIARTGALWAGEIGDRGLTDPALIHDFADMAFTAREAPYEGVSA